MRVKNIFIIIGLLACIHVKSQTTSSLNLLPFPKQLEMQQGQFRLTQNFSVAVHETASDTILIKGINRMIQTLNRKTGLYFTNKSITSKDNSDTAALQITVSKSVLPYIGTDESYLLVVSNDKIILKAPTTLGALHGFETIIQLLSKNKGNGDYYFPSLKIEDAPRFEWRGLMIDVARHFIPLDVVERNIEAMAAVKMNVLHLHLSDNEGFRIESKVFPQLQDKGSNGEYFTQAQMKGLVAFAQERGIIVVPEFDMPGHSKSWFAGYPQLSSEVDPNHPAPPMDFKKIPKLDLKTILQFAATAPSPAMNPAKESTYQFIDKFLGEMSTIFPSPYIHIGADENNGVVWKNNPSIVAFMKANKIPDTHELQAYFVSRVEKIVAKHHKKTIAWEEAFSKDISKDVTLQVWRDSSYFNKAIGHGNNVLVSRGFYLDMFMPAYIYYNNKNVSAELPGLIKGGEAAQWAEVADRTNIETRIWPRAAAVAERFWSPASVNNTDDMYRRLFALSDQLDEQGLQLIADYERGVRRISNDHFGEVKTLTDVLTPVKGLKKLFAQLMKPEALTYPPNPLTEVSDIVPVDSRVKWKFREAVKSFLINKDTLSENIIRNYLQQWQNNHEQLKSLFGSSSQLKLVEQHSKNLSAIAAIGLKTLDKIKNGITPDENWTNQQMAILKEADKAYGQTELSIIPEIESLIKQQLVPLPESYALF